MNIIIVGSSAAGISAMKTIRSFDQDAKITMVSSDLGYYSRCQLHLVASGHRSESQAHLLQPGWEKDFNIEFLGGSKLSAVDSVKKSVSLEDGRVLNYDRLLLATGARTFFPPVKGIEGPATFGLRNLEDAIEIKQTLETSAYYTIIGAGLVGVELAFELAELGKKVAVVEMAPIPLPMQLEEQTGAMCRQRMESAGIELYCGETACEVVRKADGSPDYLKLKSGKTIRTDVLVCAAGVKANLDFAGAAGIKTGRGIVIDEFCQTSVPDIFAAGDVAETHDALIKQVIPSAIWPVAVRQGKIAAMNMLGRDARLERNTGFKASVVIQKTPVISLGPVYKIAPEWQRRDFRYANAGGNYNVKTFFIHENRLKAAVLWGDITNAGLYFEAIINDRPIESDLAHIDSLDAAKRGTEQLQVL